MKITINYLAQLKQAAGIETESIILDNSCGVRDLIAKLAEKHGEPLRSFLIDSERNLNNSIMLIVDDTQIHLEEPVQLKEGSTVSFLSPLAGG